MTALRLKHLHPRAANYKLFIEHADRVDDPVDLSDYGNVHTRLDPCCRPLATAPDSVVDVVSAVAASPGVEQVAKPDGSVSLRVRGLEFARANGSGAVFGLNARRPLDASSLQEALRLAAELGHCRRADPPDRLHPLLLKTPESWLESQVRAGLREVDATLEPAPVYSQAPTLAGMDRGLIDLLAIDHSGRLAILELKASEDIHLPLQGLDYWIRVKWHLDRGEFAERGYFPGRVVRPEAPRLLFVGPALHFHSSIEVVLRYFSPEVDVERIGVGLEWQKQLKVMFRYRR